MSSSVPAASCLSHVKRQPLDRPPSPCLKRAGSLFHVKPTGRHTSITFLRDQPGSPRFTRHAPALPQHLGTGAADSWPAHGHGDRKQDAGEPRPVPIRILRPVGPPKKRQEAPSGEADSASYLRLLALYRRMIARRWDGWGGEGPALHSHLLIRPASTRPREWGAGLIQAVPARGLDSSISSWSPLMHGSLSS